MSKSKTKNIQFDPADIERVELETHVKTQHEDYTDDSQGDPEGAARRAANVERQLYPDWVFSDYELSTSNIWGKRNPDGKPHLVASSSTIQAILNCHDSGMSNQKEIEGMYSLTSEADVTTLVNHYIQIMDVVGSTQHFAVMRGVGDATTAALAERAYRKYLYRSAYDRALRTTNANAALPEYVENLETRGMEAAAKAGLWHQVHKELWSYTQWKGSPKYYVENEVKLRLVNAAKYIEANHKAVEPIKPTMADHGQMLMAF